MKLKELKVALLARPQEHPIFTLPNGDAIPPNFHVTEVGHVRKNFVDCGGTVRSSESCLLQFWTSERDPDHRLTAEKFASILQLGGRVLRSDEVEVEVEWDCCVVAQYTIAALDPARDGLHFQLEAKHTDCLAKEKCGLGEDDCGCGAEEEAVAGNVAARASCC